MNFNVGKTKNVLPESPFKYLDVWSGCTVASMNQVEGSGVGIVTLVIPNYFEVCWGGGRTTTRHQRRTMQYEPAFNHWTINGLHPTFLTHAQWESQSMDYWIRHGERIPIRVARNDEVATRQEEEYQEFMRWLEEQ